jgi:hypothetical protein
VKTPGKITILTLLAALVALAIAGCGGGGDETTDTTAAATTEEPQQLTKAEVIDQGDGICAEVNAAVGALGAETETAAVPETIEKTANLYTGMVERLQGLGAPEGDGGDYAKVMEAAEELAKVEGEVKLAAEREDTEALGEAANEATPALEEFETQATIYGFKDCGEGPSAPSAVTPGSEPGAEAGEEVEGLGEEGGVEVEPEYVEPEEEAPPVEEAAPETGGAGGGAEAAPEVAPESGGGSESGGVGPG